MAPVKKTKRTKGRAPKDGPAVNGEVRVSCGPGYGIRAYRVATREAAWEAYLAEFGMRVERNGGKPYYPDDHPEDEKPRKKTTKKTPRTNPFPELEVEAPPTTVVDDV